MDQQERVEVYQLPKRPRGLHSTQKFSNVEIVTNFYRVQIKPMNQIHIYRLKFTPPIALDDRATRKNILEVAIQDIKKVISDPVFSGFNIYSIRPPQQKQFTVKTPTHEVSIKQVKVLNVKENNNILVHFLNNGLRNLMHRLNYIQIGKTGKYFNSQKKQKIQDLIMYSGYKANFMQLEKGIYLRVDTAKKIVRNQTVLQFINQLYRNNPDKSKDQKRQMVKQELINKIIMTNYGKTRYVKILDVQFNDIETIMIPDQNISIRAYYTQKYNLIIQNSKQPLLIVQEKRKKEDKTYMIPEICLMTGIPDDFDQFRRKKVSQATIKEASQRKYQISQLMNEIKKTSQVNSLKQIGIRIESQMQRFKAKIIPPPRIQLGNGCRIQEGKSSNFQLFGQPIFASKHSLHVGVIHFRSAAGKLNEMLDTFESTVKNLAISFKTTMINAGDFDSRKAISSIDDCIYKAVEKQNCNICLVIIPDSLKSQYKKVKERCLLNNKIICQVATEGTLYKKNLRSIATKILLQMIAKRGNTLWVPQSTLKLNGVMLAAFDTAKQGSTNVMSGVATMNSSYSSICSKISQFTDTNDKLNCMMTTMLKLIDSYNKRNKEPPKEVVMFANSCSNDQMSLYDSFMIKPLKQKLEEVYTTNAPCLSFVLVNTKTSQRFFVSQGGENVKNVPAGTIVSQNIVSNNYDFFLVSQFATRGTTVPNHYKVIYTDSKMEQGVLQELVYSQCFNYVNWTGSIKVPGILQYAKKCVKFNTEVIESKKLCQDLENKLYFI